MSLPSKYIVYGQKPVSRFGKAQSYPLFTSDDFEVAKQRAINFSVRVPEHEFYIRQYVTHPDGTVETIKKVNVKEYV